LFREAKEIDVVASLDIFFIKSNLAYTMNPTNAVYHRKKKSWSDYFLDQKNERDLDLSDIATKFTDDGTKLMNVVKAFQETAALLVPGAHNYVRFIHHCFNDLARNRVVGVCGLERSAPFKETD
jgi:hypothetical protein